MMLTGFISQHFKVEKSKGTWKTTESITVTQTDQTYGIEVNKNDIDEIILLLQKSKNLFEDERKI